MAARRPRAIKGGITEYDIIQAVRSIQKDYRVLVEFNLHVYNAGKRHGYVIGILATATRARLKGGSDSVGAASRKFPSGDGTGIMGELLGALFELENRLSEREVYETTPIERFLGK